MYNRNSIYLHDTNIVILLESLYGLGHYFLIKMFYGHLTLCIFIKKIIGTAPKCFAFNPKISDVF